MATFLNLESAKSTTAGAATPGGAFPCEIPRALLSAGVVASSFPLIALVAVFQKRFVAGLTAGAGN